MKKINAEEIYKYAQESIWTVDQVFEYIKKSGKLPLEQFKTINPNGILKVLNQVKENTSIKFGDFEKSLEQQKSRQLNFLADEVALREYKNSLTPEQKRDIEELRETVKKIGAQADISIDKEFIKALKEAEIGEKDE